jgi:signal transduction histidine kinase
MLRDFIQSNRSELIDRCRARVARRRAPRPTPFELEYGVPIFMDQLMGMLPGAALIDGAGSESDMDHTAMQHGLELLRHEFTIDQVVHDYGDLFQAITELAIEQGMPITVPEFSALNRRLDEAIAAAVGEWSREREVDLGAHHASATNERLGMLGHEMRNQLNTAILALAAIKGGGVGFGGATAAALDRSLLGMRNLIDKSLAEVRLQAAESAPLKRETIDVASFLHDIQVGAALEASSMKRELWVLPVEEGLMIEADRQLLAAAVANLLQNAFKFTRDAGQVLLRAKAAGNRVLIEIEDECGGLPPGAQEIIFRPFKQAATDQRGVGLGLAISRRSVEADGGKLSVRDVPGHGCIFTIDMPRFERP